ncbi:hypothetical protein R2351_25455 [Mycobacteroides chelonae]|nr:hypothetical protein [Mycobacteroides chelonae]MEC4905901.1 hypothetical protein [Mycobacteroides chelonae]
MYIPKKKNTQQENTLNNLAEYNQRVQQQWAIRKLEYNNFYYEDRRKENEQSIVDNLQDTNHSNKDIELEL